jgi:hypothetical protein
MRVVLATCSLAPNLITLRVVGGEVNTNAPTMFRQVGRIRCSLGNYWDRALYGANPPHAAKIYGSQAVSRRHRRHRIPRTAPDQKHRQSACMPPGLQSRSSDAVSLVVVWLGKTRWVMERTISWLHNFRRLRLRLEWLVFIH